MRISDWSSDVCSSDLRDAADRDILLVTALEHGGERDQTHRRGGGAADADHGREHRADEHRPGGEPAAQSAHPMVHQLVHLFGDATSLEHRAHEYEHGHGHEHEHVHGHVRNTSQDPHRGGYHNHEDEN